MSIESTSKRKLRYEDYERIADDGMRHEIIDGKHHMNPAPNPHHQYLSRRIQFQLYTQIELTGLGQVINAPIDVQLSDHDIVQPDLVIVLSERLSIITATRILGAPNLVVEIVSDSTSKNDRTLKKALYCRSKVPEYWIVDPNQRVIQQFVLGDSEYELVGQHSDQVQLHILPDVSVNLSEVW